MISNLIPLNKLKPLREKSSKLYKERSARFSSTAPKTKRFRKLELGSGIYDTCCARDALPCVYKYDEDVLLQTHRSHGEMTRALAHIQYARTTDTRVHTRPTSSSRLLVSRQKDRRECRGRKAITVISRGRTRVPLTRRARCPLLLMDHISEFP